ncbi:MULTISPECIES: hypothetical protein [Kocuria]|uniref:Lipoprotein n=1 Tax=Kocuria subflava TaxID=1736139 RepID=A0A846TS54_9MICC|nr:MULTISPECIES: hypothetical protein [Kocuria]NKE08582.1 hypothetical protein [Kocuria subflava]
MKRPLLTTCTVTLSLVLASCGTGGSQNTDVQFTDDTGEVTVLTDPGQNATQTSVAASNLAFTRAQTVVVSSPESVSDVGKVAQELQVPLLISGDDDALGQELDRLQAQTVIVAQGESAPEIGDRDVVEVQADSQVDQLDLPEVSVAQEASTGVVLIDPQAQDTDGEAAAATEAAVATVNAAGGTAVEVPGGDPRVSGDSVEVARSADDHNILALGESFGSSQDVESRMQAAQDTTAELPGGGQLAFPGRRMIAVYGSPGTSALGVLGEQDVDATIELVQEMAREYQPYSDEQVIPAFEIITTIASAEPGADGNYTNELDPETLRPWIDAAGEAGVYVVLDLQPGRVDFLSQAQRYEDLLREPHVGLALDPEWRLEDGQRHMEQIGSVSADEINQVSDWLAQLTAENNLPQKVLILHQFKLAMITDREQINTAHDELAITLHADGHGSPELKMATWEALQNGLPEGIWMAWKNFYDEDTPVFSPEETYDVDPKPWFVSYQ